MSDGYKFCNINLLAALDVDLSMYTPKPGRGPCKLGLQSYTKIKYKRDEEIADSFTKKMRSHNKIIEGILR